MVTAARVAMQLAEQPQLDRLERGDRAGSRRRRGGPRGRARRRAGRPAANRAAPARSTSSAEWLMSPKSTIPVMRPASSTRALSVVRSVWTTCARSAGHAGTTTASNRSSTRSTSARWPASRIAGSELAGPRRVLDVPEHRPLSSAGGRTRAAPGRAGPWSRPSATSAASDRSRGSLRPRPGRSRTPRTWWRPVGAVDGRSPAMPGRRRSRRDEPRDGQRQGRVDPPGVQDGERLHVEDRRVLGRVRELQIASRGAGGVEQQERLVALAARGRGRRPRRRRTCGPAIVERPPRASNAGRGVARTASNPAPWTSASMSHRRPMVAGGRRLDGSAAGASG